MPKLSIVTLKISISQDHLCDITLVHLIVKFLLRINNSIHHVAIRNLIMQMKFEKDDLIIFDLKLKCLFF